ncbi:hypothetical protein DWF00_19690 [Bosea caraganae]|uniref:Uncharacterized protein n=1 Tax=Bosea caraganae TaxID=2763117 RepID=A0A370KXN5_9HYPH|nr:DUF6352 family protein [Bosea caraganae]RDJ19706.1 hypothetical protein DWE98_28455 [Bosea caraganae]RDJ24350.1 hypothetical protein DWF00_19690 [Bosea caraganae]
MSLETRTVTEFWVSSGHHMTRRTEGGGLAITDEMILAYLARPELVPPEEACEAERGLHALLMKEPRHPVTRAMVEAVADADARENWQFMIGFRDRLIAHPSLEAAYLAIVRKGAQRIPPLFLNQLVHLILRNALDGCEDPFILRAAELLFRAQKGSLKDDTLLLADQELIEELDAERQSLLHTAPLAAMMGQDALSELDVMTEETAPSYWSRSDAFSMVLNIGGDARSREAFCRVLETWIAHMLGVETRIAPAERVEDADWRWFVGLDAEATAIGNRLWRGEEPDATERARICGLFRLDFADPRAVDPKIAGKPVYLIMALTEDMILRVKPQNLIVGLPLAGALAA